MSQRLFTTALACALLSSGCAEGDVHWPARDTAQTPQPDIPVAETVEVAPIEPSDPGRVTLHRLNRAEYDNTVTDLLGTRLSPAQAFPPDEAGFGFDNNADVLSLTPLVLELYERAAESLVTEALREPLWEPFRLDVPAQEADELIGLEVPDGGVLLFSAEGRISHLVQVPLSGTYTYTAVAYNPDPDVEPSDLRLLVGPEVLTTETVAATVEAPDVFEVTVELKEGPALLAVELTNAQAAASGGLRSFIVVSLGLHGPAEFVAPDPNQPTPRERLLVCEPDDAHPAACAREILEAFLPRAWRRPSEDGEVERLLALFDLGRAEGLDFEDAIALPLQAALISPNFLFRVEVDPEPTATDAYHPLSDFELASRLSYFLWSSMPDAALFDAAAAGRLHDPDELGRQVDRMLDDPRSSALVRSFAGQWLYVRAVDEAAPDAWAFPDFDEELRVSMRRETELFFATFVSEDRSMLELLTADDTFVDDRLAAHYGLPPVGPGFARVYDVGPRRGGILRQAGMLTAMSYPIRTSPVRRGKWVLEQLLCDAPPPPPAGVEGLVEDDETPKTLREKMEEHRENPVCAGCHMAMDPIGLGLEHYDGIGAWRDIEVGQPIDATGVLPSGETFDGASEMIQVLASDSRLPKCMTEQLFTYALGRGPMVSDPPHLERINEAFGASGHRLRALVKLIVTSDPFRMRRGQAEEVSP